MDRKTGMIFFALAIGIGMLSVAYAQDIGAQSVPQPRIEDLVLLGDGIAVSSGDPSSFSTLRIGIATIKPVGDNTTVTAGLMDFGDKRFQLKNLVIGNSSVSGAIFDNSTPAGSFSVSSVIKNLSTVWYGGMSINGQGYNMYILSAPRPIKGAELQDKVREYCQANPGDPNCANGPGAGLCGRDPNNAQCGEILRMSCLSHPNDERCRTEFSQFCSRPIDNANICSSYEHEASQKFCESHMTNRRCQEIEGANASIPGPMPMR